MKMAAAVWVLLTVSHGVVHQESGFHSQHICEEAASLAKYGRSAAEHKADEKANLRAHEERILHWYATHLAKPHEGNIMFRESISDGDCSYIEGGVYGAVEYNDPGCTRPNLHASDIPTKVDFAKCFLVKVQ